MNSIKRFYNSNAAQFGLGGDRREKIFQTLSKFSGLKVLEVGCWNGMVGGEVRKNNNFVVGWDISRKALVKAKKVLNETATVDLDSDQWPSAKNNFGLIICSEVLEHLFDPEKVLTKLKKYMKRGGHILLTTPNILHLYRRIQFLFGKFEYRDDSVINRSHLHFYTRNSFVEMIGRLGLEIVRENNVIFPRTGGFLWKMWPNLFANQTVILVRLKDSKPYGK